jgi:membrane fusion protein (multidrug efflux system)
MVNHFIAKKVGQMKHRTVTVSTQPVKTQTWHPRIMAVGTLAAEHAVAVNAEVGGQIIAIPAKAGQRVEKGALLFQLDDAVDRETIKNDQARLKLAALTYRRHATLYRQSAVSRATLDQSKAEWIEAQSALSSAIILKEQKAIRAPFSGKIGLIEPSVGSYVHPGDALVTLAAIDSLSAEFSLPQQSIGDLYVGQPIEVTVEAYPDEVFLGHITATDSTVSEATRTLAVEGSVPNAKHSLYPGIFAHFAVVLKKEKNSIMVPQTAITYSLSGDFVYVVTRSKESDNKDQLIATQRFVKLGERQGNQVVVESGLKAGDEVVVAGQIKLANNTVITVNNDIKMAP